MGTAFGGSSELSEGGSLGSAIGRAGSRVGNLGPRLAAGLETYPGSGGKLSSLRGGALLVDLQVLPDLHSMILHRRVNMESNSQRIELLLICQLYSEGFHDFDISNVIHFLFEFAFIQSISK